MNNLFTNKEDPIQVEYQKMASPRVENVDIKDAFLFIGKSVREDEIISESVPSKIPVAAIKAFNSSKSWESPEISSPKHIDVHSAFHHPTENNDPYNILGAVSDYSFGSRDLNNSLHAAHSGKKLLQHYNLKSAKNLDFALDNAPKSSKEVVVYSGIHTNPMDHFLKNVDQNGNVPEHITIHHPAFLSTSSSPNIAKTFGAKISHANFVEHESKFEPRANSTNKNIRPMDDGTVKHAIMLKIPKGTAGLSLSGGVYDRQALVSEQEILLHRGHDIKIHRSPTITNNHVIWHAEVVGNRRKPLDSLREPE